MRALAVLVLLAAPVLAQSPGKVIEHELPPKKKTGDPLVFAVYAPARYDAQKPAPLILALHAGRGNARRFCGFLRSAAEAQGALLVCPQGFRELVGADGYWWKGDKAEMALLDRLLAHVRKEFKIDEARITLVGLADGAELGLRWALTKDRGLQGVIVLNFLWKLRGTPRAKKDLKVCLIASKDAKEKLASLKENAEKAQKFLARAKYPVVVRIVPGTSRSFFHGWEKEFRKAFAWFDGKLDWPAEIEKAKGE